MPETRPDTGNHRPKNSPETTPVRGCFAYPTGCGNGGKRRPESPARPASPPERKHHMRTRTDWAIAAAILAPYLAGILLAALLTTGR